MRTVPLLHAGLALALVSGLAACGSSPEPSAAPATVTATVTLPALTETVETPGPARTTVTLPPVTKTVIAQPPAPKADIEEGVWVVGEDIKAGTYRTIDEVSDGCYWKISRSGTNGDDIISNDLPTGGRPRVTLKKGQDFQTSDCGSWTKLG